MKKLLKNKKFVLYAALILVVVLMWVCGSLNTTKSSASYRSTISSTDGAKVAKWSILSTDKDISTLNLEVGFKEKVSNTDSGKSGDWFLDLENASEVNAMLDPESKVILELHHDTFTGLTNQDWNFLGSVNPLKFTVSLYNGNIDDVVKYESTTGNTISYTEYQALTSSQSNYTLTVDESKILGVVLDTSTKPSFTSSEIVNGKMVYKIEIKFSDIFQDSTAIKNLIFGMGTSQENKVLRLSWTIVDTSIVNDTVQNDNTSVIVVKDDDALDNLTKEEGYTYIVTATNKKYQWNGTSLVEVLYYLRYELSTIPGATRPSTYASSNVGKSYIAEGTDPDGYSVDFGTDKEVFYINEIPCDFAEYFLFSRGEPTFTFGSLIKKYKNLSADDRTSINARTVVNTGTGTATTSESYDNLKAYIEKLELPQYDIFQKEYVAFTSGSIYLSYGLTCKIKFELKVTQVD